MAVIDDVTSEDVELTNAELENTREIIRRAVWAWYDANLNDVVLRKWFFSFRLRDLRFLVELIIGSET